MNHPQSCGPYYQISNTQSDQIRRISSIQQQNEKWTISNLLPFDIDLYCSPKYNPSSKFISNIKAQSTLNFNYDAFNEGDELLTMVGDYMLMDPEILHSSQKNIKVGGAVYRSTDGGREYSNDYTDISSVQIHNHFPFPIELIFKGAIVAQIGGSDGLTYKGGSNSVLNFNNSWQGLNIGDKLTFKICSNYSSGLQIGGKYLYTALINDNHVGEIHVGMISSDCSYPMNDTVSYSVNAPPLTGITYYESIGDYTSKQTNPLSFI